MPGLAGRAGDRAGIFLVGDSPIDGDHAAAGIVPNEQIDHASEFEWLGERVDRRKVGQEFDVAIDLGR